MGIKYTDEMIIQNIKDCGQSIIDNAEKIVVDYKYKLHGMTITCHVNEDGYAPYIEVNTSFYPESMIERCSVI